MKVEVKLFAFFRENRFKVKVFEFDQPVSVLQVINQLDINPDEVGVTMINNRHCRHETMLHENDSLGIFPLIGGG
ncbi:MoaD/ThiS family protein [Desulfopila inferna]|uniref:MoaD/ThiS family protein n=1 Tax=Desulfopila inferna TaxID=468528 RepID=UPI0019636CE3|nr:MoaD/ThiS family protein [Desulfopila inferna]MBM9602625.1 MoaD/ThiS family protein [Desulfopila inferna]